MSNKGMLAVLQFWLLISAIITVSTTVALCIINGFLAFFALLLIGIIIFISILVYKGAK